MFLQAALEAISSHFKSETEDQSNELFRLFEDIKLTYEWTQEGCADASLIDGLPLQEVKDEIKNIDWFFGLIGGPLGRIFLNTASYNIHHGSTIEKERKKLRLLDDGFKRIIDKVTGILPFESSDFDILSKLKLQPELETPLSDALDDYKDQFDIIKLPAIAKFEEYLSDEVFGWYRVAGPNPMRIAKLTKPTTEIFPKLTDQVFNGIKGFGSDSLQAASEENRLYIVDIPELDGLEVGSITEKDKSGKEIVKKKKSYIYSPRALFAVPKEAHGLSKLLPIAIQCNQDSQSPLFTANRKVTDNATWLAAKLTVQVSDAVIHEIIYHLGRTHLLLEVFVCATHRVFDESHVIYKLLKPHFFGTALINFAAVKTLINDDGAVNDLLAPRIEDMRSMAAKSINARDASFNDLMPDVELKARGVDESNEVIHFPYRDYALQLWDIIKEWVSAYISKQYPDDRTVQQDSLLDRWCEEITASDKGNLPGFGENGKAKIESVDYLVRVLSMVIFTASVQHAAVNFPQSGMMEYTPMMPLSGFAPAPVQQNTYTEEVNVVEKMIPDLDVAYQQLEVMHLLGSFQYKRLGAYGDDEVDESEEHIASALCNLQKRLAQLEAEITGHICEERKAGLPLYSYLLPSNIPQSINI